MNYQHRLRQMRNRMIAREMAVMALIGAGLGVVLLYFFG